MTQSLQMIICKWSDPSDDHLQEANNNNFDNDNDNDNKNNNNNKNDNLSPSSRAGAEQREWLTMFEK